MGCSNKNTCTSLQSIYLDEPVMKRSPGLGLDEVRVMCLKGPSQPLLCVLFTSGDNKLNCSK